MRPVSAYAVLCKAYCKELFNKTYSGHALISRRSIKLLITNGTENASIKHLKRRHSSMSVNSRIMGCNGDQSTFLIENHAQANHLNLPLRSRYNLREILHCLAQILRTGCFPLIYPGRKPTDNQAWLKKC